ncbi:hypothetical protein HGRIS_002065 [Hohenbuehelia grisea]|uniref:Uncharacterized protein n=1 Tax=Hohenbuehelia grisea TaxID=104357 RepID=A0ABR3JJC4_9AGAR
MANPRSLVISVHLLHRSSSFPTPLPASRVDHLQLVNIPFLLFAHLVGPYVLRLVQAGNRISSLPCAPPNSSVICTVILIPSSSRHKPMSAHATQLFHPGRSSL